MQTMWIRVLVAEVGWLLSLETFARGGYSITVTTGSRSGAGTDSVMNYRLRGTNGDSRIRVFPEQVSAMFESESVDAFYEPDDFGILEVVTVGHDYSGMYAGWYFEQVNIHDELRGYDYRFVCNCWIPEDTIDYYKSFSNTDRTMNTNETLLRWETNLCHLDQEPQVYQDIGEYVTGSLSDRLSQTCERLFPPQLSFVASVMFIHRILPSRTPRLNVIGRYIDCSPITGLWMYAMGNSDVLRPCLSYVGVNVGDFTTCRFLCDTDGLVSYVVLGISDRRALPTSDAADVCDIVVV